jgi:hypothetical protein
MDEREQQDRTTAAVRARDHAGDCVVVFAAGSRHNLTPDQRDEVERQGGEIAEPRARVHAEITAFERIGPVEWKPLALGVAPESDDICPACREYIETTTFHTSGTVISDREAAWP